MSNDFSRQLGRNAKASRQKAGISNRAMRARMPMVAHLEPGRCRWWLRHLYGYATALGGCSLTGILRGTYEPRRQLRPLHEYVDTIRRRLRRERIRQGIGYRELEGLLLAEGFNVNYSTLCRYESGRIPDLPLDLLPAWHRVLGLPDSWSAMLRLPSAPR